FLVHKAPAVLLSVHRCCKFLHPPDPVAASLPGALHTHSREHRVNYAFFFSSSTPCHSTHKINPRLYWLYQVVFPRSWQTDRLSPVLFFYSQQYDICKLLRV